jgi:tetratricopeptide (TPR) repeat protein
MAPLFFGGCRYRQVLKIGEEISTDYANRLGPQTRTHLLIMRGVANFGVGEHKTAWEQTKAACTLDDETPSTHQNPFGGADPAIVSRGYATMSGLPLGRVDQCLSLAQEALDIARERNHAFTLAWAQLVAARMYREVGRFDEALSAANEAIAVCERYGFAARLGTVLLQSGAAYCRIGDMERGLADSRRGLELWRSNSSRLHMSYYLSDFADCLLRAKKYDEADQVLQEAEQIVAETDERSHVGELLRLRGLFLAFDGNVLEGSAKLWEAIEWAGARETKLFELRALRDLTFLDVSTHEKKRATTALQQVVAWFPQGLEIPDLLEARDAM